MLDPVQVDLFSNYVTFPEMGLHVLVDVRKQFHDGSFVLNWVFGGSSVLVVLPGVRYL
jgi:hypothetical protein